MADYERYSREHAQPRGDYERSRQYRENQEFENRRLDDRTGYGYGSAGGYRVDRGQGRDQGYRSYERDDSYGAYGDYRDSENRSFEERTGRTGGYGGVYRRYSGAGGSQGGYDSGSSSGNRGYRSYSRPAYAYLDNPGDPIAADWGTNRDYGDYHRGGDYRSDRGQDRGHRGFWEKASDEVSSWFGDEAAHMRREQDERISHRGKGPKGYKRSDERIRDDISDRLSDDHYLDASNIEVQVSETEVTLTGTVPSRECKRRAERLAEDISGVSHVQNNLRVDASSSVSSGNTISPAGTVLDKQAAGRA